MGRNQFYANRTAIYVNYYLLQKNYVIVRKSSSKLFFSVNFCRKYYTHNFLIFIYDNCKMVVTIIIYYKMDTVFHVRKSEKLSQ